MTDGSGKRGLSRAAEATHAGTHRSWRAFPSPASSLLRRYLPRPARSKLRILPSMLKFESVRFERCWRVCSWPIIVEAEPIVLAAPI